MKVLDLRKINQVCIPKAVDVSTGQGVLVPKFGLSNKYAFKMPMTPGITPKDLRSGNLLTTTLPGIRYDTVNGVFTEFAVNEPVITELGLRGGGVIENKLLHSGDISNVVYFKQAGVSISEETIIAPDGVTPVKKIIGNNINGVYQASLSVSTTEKNTKQVWMRSSSGTVSVRLQDPNQNSDYLVAVLSETWELFSLTQVQIGGLAGIWVHYIPVAGIYMWGMQLSQSAYPLPYVPTTTAPVTTVTEAGSTDYGNRLEDLSTSFQQLYDALDGEADGVELVADGDFYSTIVYPNSLRGYQYNNGVLTHDGSNTSGQEIVSNFFTLNPSVDYIVISFDVISADVNAQFRVYDDIAVSYKGIYDLSSYIGSKVFIRIQNNTYNSLVIRNQTEGASYAINNISVQKITSAAGSMHFEWTPLYNAADVSGDLNIISFDGATNHLWYDATNNQLELTDGTNTATVALECVANTTYTIKAVWGNHPVEGNDKMQLIVDDTEGAFVDFDGSFDPGDEAYFSIGNDEHHYTKILNVLKANQYRIPIPWQPTIPTGYSLLTSDGTTLTSGGEEITSGGTPLIIAD